MAAAGLAAVVARLARRRVIFPIRIFAAIAIAGIAAALAAFAGAPVPRGFLSMAAALALAFAVNRRPTATPRRPALRRAAWIGAAALMFAAIPSDVPRGAGAASFAAGEIDLALIVGVALALVASLTRIVAGIRADPEDRLLVGALGGVVAFLVLSVRLPPPPIEWMYPLGVAMGAALARAGGNLAIP